ncbi:MAG: hypothetical protein KA712_17095 [Myxococcales bacterium]|nr:hypothetical protein [Myxococcales bacterium]
MLGVLVGAGIAANGFLHAYDTSSWAPASLLSLVSASAAFLLFRKGLVRFGSDRDGASVTAAWATISWHAVPLSQVPYLGFFLIPPEILAATVIARKKQRKLGFGMLLILSAIVRMGSIACGYALRALWRLAP